jgi:hypothetical protein
MSKVTSYFKQQKGAAPATQNTKKLREKPEKQLAAGDKEAAAGKDGETTARPRARARAARSPQLTRRCMPRSAADLTEEQRTLRAFDLASEFGPCTGLTRLER